MIPNEPIALDLAPFALWNPIMHHSTADMGCNRLEKISGKGQKRVVSRRGEGWRTEGGVCTCAAEGLATPLLLRSSALA